MLVLQRISEEATFTVGKLFYGTEFICYTLEDVVREQLHTPVSDWKIKAQTAIPSTLYSGKPYPVTLEVSQRFGVDCPTVNNVPGFTAIRMHAGNTEADTEGCLILGDAVDSHGITPGTSRPAVHRVREVIRKAISQGLSVTLTVLNTVTQA